MGSDRSSGLLFFVSAFLLSILTPLVLTVFVCFILFHLSRTHERVFGKTLLHEFPNITCFFFRQCTYKCAMCVLSENVETLSSSKSESLYETCTAIEIKKNGTRVICAPSDVTNVFCEWDLLLYSPLYNLIDQCSI